MTKIEELKEELSEAMQRIADLEHEVADLEEIISKDAAGNAALREVQEELAKLAGVPVGSLFTYYRA
jgi:predicted nuclease with TOPRIM domain